MKLNDAFPSNWLSAEDLEEGDLTVTISNRKPVDFVEFTAKGKPTPERKPVLYFDIPRDTKPLILNKTNWKLITEVLKTDETDEWGGQQVTLYATEVEAFGQITLGIRVRLRKPTAKKPINAPRRPAPPSRVDESEDEYWRRMEREEVEA